MLASRRRAARRAGFTILEVLLVGSLTALLAGMLVQTWSAYDRAATEIAARCELAQEADFAVSQLALDLAAADPTLGPLVGLRYSPDLGGRLELCHDGGSAPDGRADWDPSGSDVIVAYALLNPGAPGPLLRRVGAAGEPAVVAHSVLAIRARTLVAPFVQIDLTLRHPLPNLVRRPTPSPLERTYTLIATLP